MWIDLVLGFLFIFLTGKERNLQIFYISEFWWILISGWSLLFFGGTWCSVVHVKFLKHLKLIMKPFKPSSPLSFSVSKHLLAIIESLLPVTLNKHIIITRTSNREGVCTATEPGLPLDPAQPLTLSGVRIRVWQPHTKPCSPDSFLKKEPKKSSTA